MFQLFMPAIIVLGLAYTVFKLVELYARRKERMTLIEKCDFKNGLGAIPDMSGWISLPSATSFSSLRLGLLLSGIGSGLVIAIIMNYYMLNIDRDMLYFALMALCGGLGLVIAYLIEQKKSK